MKLSIVIPSYNSASGLKRSLHYLQRQQLPEGGALEVIVLDDGSSDDTAATVEGFTGQVPGLQYVFQARDARSCRSRARNLGAARATGEVLTFLDAGVLVGPTFVRQVLERYATGKRRVLLHHTHGLFASLEAAEKQELVDLTPDTFHAVLARLREDLEWIEPREPFFELTGGELDRLPGAWALGWSVAFSVHRELFERVRGFDEEFLAWGDEDCDLTYRLGLEGGELWAEREAVALHWPHPRAPRSPREDEERLARRRYLHRKRHELETELFLYTDNLFLPQAVGRFEQLVATYAQPLYPRDFLQALSARLPERGRSLLVGMDHVWSARQLRTSHLAVHSRGALASFRAAFPEREVLRTLCLDTPFEAGAFEVALVTDFVRLLGPTLQEAMVRELLRIARNVWMVHAEGYTSFSQLYENQHWASLDELRSVAGKAGGRLLPDGQHGSFHTFRLVSDR